jgi:Ca2+-binding EF-hand superfamily protein
VVEFEEVLYVAKEMGLAPDGHAKERMKEAFAEADKDHDGRVR